MYENGASAAELSFFRKRIELFTIPRHNGGHEIERNEANDVTGKKIAAALSAAAVLGAAEVLRRPFWGGRADREDRRSYAQRADNFDGKFFVNPEEWALPGIGEDHPLSGKPQRPRHPLPGLRKKRSGSGDAVTWLGHSTLLLTMAGKNVLIDPIFSRHCAPVPLRGFLRYSRPPVRVEKLPPIDVVLLTHDHYDHLDYPTVRHLRDRVGCFVVPLGVEKHLLRWGVPPERIRALCWWEETSFDDLTVICTPCRHNSGRATHRRTLCCSWVLRDGEHQVYESGDTGWGGHFAAIHERYGDFDLAMLDCAQYDMAWHYSHMFPEESIMAAEALCAAAAMPIHWGAFVLSKHAWDDPPERFVRAAESAGVLCVTPRLGERMTLGDWESYTRRWWRGME